MAITGNAVMWRQVLNFLIHTTASLREEEMIFPFLQALRMLGFVLVLFLSVSSFVKGETGAGSTPLIRSFCWRLSAAHR